MMFNRKIKKLTSTPFSDFIREAKSAEKKRVYKEVLEKATERQREVLRKTATCR